MSELNSYLADCKKFAEEKGVNIDFPEAVEYFTECFNSKLTLSVAWTHFNHVVKRTKERIK